MRESGNHWHWLKAKVDRDPRDAHVANDVCPYWEIPCTPLATSAAVRYHPPAMSAVAMLARQRLALSSLLSASQLQCRQHAFAAWRIAAATQQARHYAKSAKKTKGKEKEKAQEEAPQRDGKKGSKGVSTDSLVPASQRIAASPEYKGTESKMQGVLDWFRKEVAALETRATGRVTPAVLSPVRVKLPESSDGRGVRLEEIATVGVKEGTTLLVTVFEEHVSRYVLPTV